MFYKIISLEMSIEEFKRIHLGSSESKYLLMNGRSKFMDDNFLLNFFTS